MQGTTTISRRSPTVADPSSTAMPAAPPVGPDLDRQRLLVSIATYNERGNLAELVSAIQA